MNGLVEAVCLAAGASPASVAVSRPDCRNDAWVVLATLFIELRVGSTQTFAKRFGFGSAQAVRNAASSGRARAVRDSTFARLCKRSMERLVVIP
ncbi:MAG: hypothetical protein ACJAXA_000974 [Candidatus Aldehydirespiratoraceae bacterium]|jgi:hypothetical protein